VPWSKLVGVVLVAFALRLAVDPDYPIPRDEMARTQARRSGAPRREPGGTASRPSSSRMLPEALAPRGPVRRSELTFRWQWSGDPAEWRIVVFDDSFEQVVEFRVGSACSHTPAAGSLSRLASGVSGFWLVDASIAGRKVSSVPMPLDLID
jgi:hypothetical protein